MSDVNIDHIEALVGPLPNTTGYEGMTMLKHEYGYLRQHTTHHADCGCLTKAADDMRDELLAVIERQAKMLRLAADESWGDGTFKELGQPMPDGYCEFYLADLTRRAEGGESA